MTYYSFCGACNQRFNSVTDYNNHINTYCRYCNQKTYCYSKTVCINCYMDIRKGKIK